jgi:hypothetical protein
MCRPQAAKHLAGTPRKGLIRFGSKVAAAPGFESDVLGPGMVGTVVMWRRTNGQWGVEVRVGGVRNRCACPPLGLATRSPCFLLYFSLFTVESHCLRFGRRKHLFNRSVSAETMF